MTGTAQAFTLPTPEAVFAAFDGALRDELGGQVAELSASEIGRLGRVTFGVAADKAVRDHWLNVLPPNSIQWPEKYAAFVNAEINSTRVRLSFHELALRALIAKVKTRAYRTYQAERSRLEGYSEFTCFRPCVGCRPTCAALGESCHRTLMFDWRGYLQCDRIDCRCDATMFGERSIRRIIATGLRDCTQNTEPVHL